MTDLDDGGSHWLVRVLVDPGRSVMDDRQRAERILEDRRHECARERIVVAQVKGCGLDR
jgi:hypothetical protein